LARQSFEQWYNAEYIRPIIPADRTEGGYQHPDAQAAWDAWQAALSHAEGEAFGWFTEDHDADKSATTYDPVVADRWRGKGWPVWPLYTHPAPHCPVCMLDERDELRGEVKRLLAEAEYADRILRSSVPERHKGVTSPIGAVQNYIAELETAPQVAVPPEWSVRRGVTDVTDPAAAVEFVIETSTENGTSYITSVWLDDEDPAHRLLATMLAAPTAPAGEKPVSDPDGLPGTPRPMSTAPRDGTMVLLLVQFTNHGVNDGFDSGPAWTIGANTYDDSGDDEWHIAGWDWQQDCFTAGEGEPLGWLPMLSAPAPDEREIAAYREALEKIAPYPASRAGELGYSACRRIAREALDEGNRLRAGKEGE